MALLKKHVAQFAVLITLSLLTQHLLSSTASAIHAIVKGVVPIPRKHGPVSLTMPLEVFLNRTEAREEKRAIGQFSNEHRFELPLNLFPKSVTKVLSDFYDGHLFRIEINYRAQTIENSRHKQIIEAANQQYGSPRINQVNQMQLIFWDDGATRLIMQVDAEKMQIQYSLTYIDNDLFHKSSRNRVQRETGGRSTYGR